METYRFQVLMEQDEDGLYVADVPALTGCHSQGETFEEAIENTGEVTRMCVRELREDGQTVESHYPEVVGIKTPEIAIQDIGMVPERLPVLTAKQVIAVLERLGFKHREPGGTRYGRYVHADGRRTTVPVHAGRDIGRGLLGMILRDIEMSPEEFKKML